MDSVDVKDLQYTVVKSRSQAIALITDIYNAEAKAMIKQLKEIENRPFNTDITYKPLNIDKVKNVQVPEMKREEDKTMDQISSIRGVLKVLKRPIKT